jgi:hypothetical protein
MIVQKKKRLESTNLFKYIIIFIITLNLNLKFTYFYFIGLLFAKGYIYVKKLIWEEKVIVYDLTIEEEWK